MYTYSSKLPLGCPLVAKVLELVVYPDIQKETFSKPSNIAV